MPSIFSNAYEENYFYHSFDGHKDVGSPEQFACEIREELSTEISVDEFLCTVEYDYPKFHLSRIIAFNES